VEYDFLIGSRKYTISIEKKGNVFTLLENGKSVEADISMISPSNISIIIKGRSHLAYVIKTKEGYSINIKGHTYSVKEISEETQENLKRDDHTDDHAWIIRSPMPGKVIKINVSENEDVRKNQTLAVVEAMKMENEIKSSVEGVVGKIFVNPGELVDSEKTIMELKQKG